MRGRPLMSINPQTLVRPFRDQWSPAEEAQAEQEQAEREALAVLESAEREMRADIAAARAGRDPYLVFLDELPEANEAPA